MGERVAIAIDPGLVANSDIVRPQVVGCFGFELSGLIHGGMTLAGGPVQQSSLDDVWLLRLAEMPDAEVELIEANPETSGGVGEAAMPLIGPAVAAALGAATGPSQTRMTFARRIAARLDARSAKAAVKVSG